MKPAPDVPKGMAEENNIPVNTKEHSSPPVSNGTGIWKRIFLSYGHDEYAALAQRLCHDLEQKGFKVWFDKKCLKPGIDYEKMLESAIDWVAKDPKSGCILLLMTPHSVRRPDGYCLNEISRAMSRSLSIVPVMVVQVEPPLSICRVQWLDMRDCIPLEQRCDKYEARLNSLLEVLSSCKLDKDGMQSRLLRYLEPIPFDADMQHHLPRFTGRKWVFDRIDNWMADPKGSRLFWLCGGPGVGKTAIASWLCYHRSEIAAFHLCRHGHEIKSNPRRCVLSIAFQLGTQIPEYRKRLNALNLENITESSSATTLFDALIVQPLSGNFPAPDHNVIILIDALDEATTGGKNELAAFIASEFIKTPPWLKLIVTSRPEPLIKFHLQSFEPYILDASAPENLGDIREFLKKELKHVPGGSALQDHAVDFIVERSEGVFLYVEQIRDELFKGHLSLDRLDDFPRGLGGIYATYFQRQFPDTSLYQDKIMPALEVICAAREPLEIAMLASIFSWKEGEKKRFISSLGSLFPVSYGKIKPFHKSVIEWLMDYDRALNYYVSLEDGHAKLAEFGWKQYEEDGDRLSAYMVTHLPAHLRSAGCAEDLSAILTDFKYLERRCAAGEVHELIKDYRETLEGGFAKPPRIVEEFSRFIQGQSHILSRHHGLIYQQAANEPDRTVVATIEKKMMGQGKRPDIWIRWVNKPGFNTSCLMTLPGHADQVKCCAYSPDGSRIVSGDGAGNIRIWDARTGKESALLQGHRYWVMCCAFSPDGTRLVSSSMDGTAKLWDLSTYTEICTFTGHKSAVPCCQFSPDGETVLTASMDKSLKLWDLRGNEIGTFEGHGEWVSSCTFSHDGKLALSASNDMTLRLWDVPGRKFLVEFKGHTGGVRGCAFSQDDSRVLSSSCDTTLKLWDLEGNVLKTFEGHEHIVNSCRFSPDSSRIISASNDMSIRMWNVNDGKEVTIFNGHSDTVFSCAFSPDGKHIISASADKTVKIWDAQGKNAPMAEKAHRDRINRCVLSPDSSKLFTASSDGTLKAMSMTDGSSKSIVSGLATWIGYCDVSPDGEAIAYMAGNESLGILDQNYHLMSRIDYRKDLLYIAVREETGDTPVMIYENMFNPGDTATKMQMRTLGEFVFSRDGLHIIAIADDNRLAILDARTGKLIGTMKTPLHIIRSIAISPDGRLISLGSLSGRVLVIDARTGEEIFLAQGHASSVLSCAFSPDGKYLLTSSADKTLKVWDTTAGKVVETLKSHDEAVRFGAYSPDGKFILSVSVDAWIRLWDAHDYRVVGEFMAQDRVYSAAWAQDSKIIVAGDGIGNAYILKIEDNR